MSNKWSQPDNPPPPLFTGQKEKDLVKQVNDELIENFILTIKNNTDIHYASKPIMRFLSVMC